MQVKSINLKIASFFLDLRETLRCCAASSPDPSPFSLVSGGQPPIRSVPLPSQDPPIACLRQLVSNRNMAQETS
jgi:hypothetical protein